MFWKFFGSIRAYLTWIVHKIILANGKKWFAHFNQLKTFRTMFHHKWIAKKAHFTRWYRINKKENYRIFNGEKLVVEKWGRWNFCFFFFQFCAKAIIAIEYSSNFVVLPTFSHHRRWWMIQTFSNHFNIIPCHSVARAP